MSMVLGSRLYRDLTGVRSKIKYLKEGTRRKEDEHLVGPGFSGGRGRGKLKRDERETAGFLRSAGKAVLLLDCGTKGGMRIGFVRLTSQTITLAKKTELNHYVF
jgi:hypothetical protein